jgi:hypothetical protein
MKVYYINDLILQEKKGLISNPLFYVGSRIWDPDLGSRMKVSGSGIGDEHPRLHIADFR